MKIKRLTTIYFFSACSLTACGNTAKTNPAKKDADVKMQKVEQLLKEDECSHTAECKSQVTYYFEDRRFKMNLNTGEAILNVEHELSQYDTAGKFRHRFLESYEFQDGELHKWNPKVNFTPKYIEILDTIYDGNFLSGEQLELIAPKIQESYRWILGSSNHNSTIIGSMAESNPHTPFVALDKFDPTHLFGKTVLCADDSNQESYVALKQKAWNLQSELDLMLSKHNVRYVNFSMQFPHRVLRDYIKRDCNKEPSESYLDAIADAMVTVMESFGNREGRVLVQAANYGAHSVWLGDTARDRLPNAISAGGYNIFNPRIDPSGLDLDHPNLSLEDAYSKYDPIGKNADVYVNFNLDLANLKNREVWSSGFAHPNTHGFGLFPVGITASTSESAPFVLSRIVNIRHDLFENETWSNDLIEKIKNKLTPQKCEGFLKMEKRCLFQNPVPNRQLEVFRLNYR